eukprot:10304792-Lingulodinium_polyedra.AAC.1
MANIRILLLRQLCIDGLGDELQGLGAVGDGAIVVEGDVVREALDASATVVDVLNACLGIWCLNAQCLLRDLVSLSCVILGTGMLDEVRCRDGERLLLAQAGHD